MCLWEVEVPPLSTLPKQCLGQQVRTHRDSCFKPAISAQLCRVPNVRLSCTHALHLMHRQEANCTPSKVLNRVAALQGLLTA